MDKEMEQYIDASYATTLNNLMDLLDRKLDYLDKITDNWKPNDELNFQKLLKIVIHTAADPIASKVLTLAIRKYNNYHTVYHFPHPHLEKLYITVIKNALIDALPSAIRIYEKFNVDMFHQSVKKRNLIKPRPIVNQEDYGQLEKNKNASKS